MGPYGWHGGGGDWAAMGMMMLVFWVVAIAAVFAFVHYLGERRDDRPHGEASQNQALRILDQRFANGDIDAEEYTQRHELLLR